LTRVAAIDCGTNSIRLLIADITNGNFKEVVREMEIVRLGQGVDQNKSFHPDAIARTLSAVEKFSARISSKGVEKVRFCATSATRDASNREIFTDGVKKILGVDVEVIPGEAGFGGGGAGVKAGALQAADPGGELEVVGAAEIDAEAVKTEIQKNFPPWAASNEVATTETREGGATLKMFQAM
jgi:hypothetical protein